MKMEAFSENRCQPVYQHSKLDRIDWGLVQLYMAPFHERNPKQHIVLYKENIIVHFRHVPRTNYFFKIQTLGASMISRRSFSGLYYFQTPYRQALDQQILQIYSWLKPVCIGIPDTIRVTTITSQFLLLLLEVFLLQKFLLLDH